MKPRILITLALTACTSATDTLPYRLVDPVRMDTLRYHCPEDGA